MCARLPRAEKSPINIALVECHRGRINRHSSCQTTARPFYLLWPPQEAARADARQGPLELMKLPLLHQLRHFLLVDAPSAVGTNRLHYECLRFGRGYIEPFAADGHCREVFLELTLN